jgi:hypothetical protein
MEQPPDVTVGESSRGAPAKHLTSRGLSRLVRWTAGRAEHDAVRLEVTGFAGRPESTDVLTSSRRYLLLAGAERPGAGHIVSLFDSEHEARAAFVSIRCTERGAEAWGEVIELAPGDGARRVCWFGAPASAYYRADRRDEPSKRTTRTVRTILDRHRQKQRHH